MCGCRAQRNLRSGEKKAVRELYCILISWITFLHKFVRAPVYWDGKSLSVLEIFSVRTFFAFISYSPRINMKIMSTRQMFDNHIKLHSNVTFRQQDLHSYRLCTNHPSVWSRTCFRISAEFSANLLFGETRREMATISLVFMYSARFLKWNSIARKSAARNFNHEIAE